MHPTFQFIVKPNKDRRYDNTRDWGIDFIVSASQEDHRFSNRYAEVLHTPMAYTGPIKPGDTLLVHHNVFKFYYDMYGRQKSGRSFMSDNTFLIDPDQFFLYKGADGKWMAHDKYCFIKPMEKKDWIIDKTCELEPLHGTIRYINEQMLSMGLKEGDEVVYEPESEYEFEVDGELLYRMFTNNIAIKL
jgi:hypothetical protein